LTSICQRLKVLSFLPFLPPSIKFSLIHLQIIANELEKSRACTGYRRV